MNEFGYSIPIKNKNGIIAYSIVDYEDYEKYGSLNWNLKNGYAASGMRGTLHRFIMNATINDPNIDHINGDRLDNRKINLRFVTKSFNAQNRKKKENTNSRYIGVNFNKKTNKWICELSFNYKKIQNCFEKEEHAAYWYNCLALKHYGPMAKINEIEKPDDFIEPIKKTASNNHIGIYENKNGSYRVYISNGGRKFIGNFDTEEKALNAYNKKKTEIEKQKANDILHKEILRNNDGYAIIELFNSKKEKNGECIIDDEKYYDVIGYKWHIKKGGYVCNSKKRLIHRFLLNPNTTDIIDHINGNKLDNRLCNLRISNPTLNSHNRLKKENTTSKYIGVSKKGKNYTAMITKDKKKHNIGVFKTEEDAAKARDKKAIELYGEHAKLNFSI